MNRFRSSACNLKSLVNHLKSSIVFSSTGFSASSLGQLAMSDQNPYAAPQATLQNVTAKLPDQITKPGLSAEFIYAAEDARYCYYGYGWLALNMLITFGCRFLGGPILLYLMFVTPVINIVAQVLCCIGLKKLSNMPQKTNAGYWFRWAWILWIMEILLSAIAFLGCLMLLSGTSASVIFWVFVILNHGLYACKNFYSLMGLWKVNRMLQDKKLVLELVIVATLLLITSCALLVFYYLYANNFGILVLFFFYVNPLRTLEIFDYVLLTWSGAVFLMLVFKALAFKRIYDQSQMQIPRRKNRQSFVDPKLLIPRK